jgi:hypothetical protein
VVAVVVAEPVVAAVLAADVATGEDVQVDVDEDASAVVLVDAHAEVSTKICQYMEIFHSAM